MACDWSREIKWKDANSTSFKAQLDGEGDVVLHMESGTDDVTLFMNEERLLALQDLLSSAAAARERFLEAAGVELIELEGEIREAEH